MRRGTLAGLLVLVCAGTAHAGGLELMPGGTRAVGRGGAVAARVEDPFALLYNPAGLGRMNHQALLLNVDVPLHDACVDPYGFYGWGVYASGDSEFGNSATDSDYVNDDLDRVCNSARVAPIPSLAWGGRIADRLGVGFGFVAPTLLGGLQFGGEDGTIDTDQGPRPTPTRYQLIKQEVLFGLNPTAGIGYALLPRLRIGAAFQALMVKAKTSVVQAGSSGTSPHDAHLVELTAEDYFIPTATVGVHVTPVDALDLGVAFRWSDGLRGPGTVQYETNTYHAGATSGPVPFANEPVPLKAVKVGLPWVFTGGVRYAGFLPDAKEAVAKGERDPMAHERWDVEVDVAYQFNKRAGKNSVEAEANARCDDVNADNPVTAPRVPCFRIGSRSAEGEPIPPLEVLEEDFTQLDIDRHLEDAIAVRVGGSYSLVPKAFALNAGAFLETRGVDPDYASIDTFGFQRIGTGVGVVWRIGEFDLMASYAHIFQEDLDVAPPGHEPFTRGTADPTTGFDQRVGGVDASGANIVGDVKEDPEAPAPSAADGTASVRQPALVSTHSRRARVVNAGLYTASFDIISVGAVYRF
jgi:hypothetical protein